MAVLLLLALSGCEPSGPARDPAADRVRAAFALAAAERAAPVRPDDGSPDDSPDDRRPDPNCPRCHGSGVVPSGDGLARVPCSCLRRNSKRQESKNQNEVAGADAEAEPAARVLVFSAGWCRACVAMKPALAAAGPGFEVIDADAHPEVARAFRVTALPTLVRLAGSRETARASGARNVSGLRRFRDEGR
ncbi:thioredoxin family protein [Alienimonas sp. DA493]|uniref:thioredoxin family protein n=1 Tax=Alienimonas sp. DA493 TaxID=3373605 RepID=UPI003754671C